MGKLFLSESLTRPTQTELVTYSERVSGQVGRPSVICSTFTEGLILFPVCPDAWLCLLERYQIVWLGKFDAGCLKQAVDDVRPLIGRDG
jgi:hypothetical protein